MAVSIPPTAAAPSDREADTAAAAGRRVRVSDHELRAGEVVDEGDLGVLEEGQGDGVDEGGLAGGLGAMRGSSRPMPTPRSTLDQIANDWREGGVMTYDAAMNTNDMRYSVMMPVEELLPYISREFRAPKDAFDGMYQHFIKNGPQNPVYVAIGRNKIKITGGEDLVWFAKRSGLEELPVFLSYQSQV